MASNKQYNCFKGGWIAPDLNSEFLLMQNETTTCNSMMKHSVPGYLHCVVESTIKIGPHQARPLNLPPTIIQANTHGR